MRVVGTNGKGTVTTMMAAGLTAAGYVTGRFLSPHVESFTERVAVDGAEVAQAEVIALARDAFAATGPGGVLEGLPDGLRPAFFEWTLALALQAAHRTPPAPSCGPEAGPGRSLPGSRGTARGATSGW